MNPLLPASYDVVWTLVLVAFLVAAVLVVAAAIKVLRRRTVGEQVVASAKALTDLHEAGEISDEEYERRRSRLLDRL
ncbi:MULTISPECIES: SHOCT domain-containing protein [Georgenia]|uniref:SHOCT domain-containing protein n=1 Tax=Georgenia TaxID=154116 RepID=UPI00143D63B0|nr:MULTISPECIES: SHOCT domain-containing protein [Georgenia]